MCGIAGAVAGPNVDQAALRSALSQALLSIRHRGPDGEGELTSPPAFMGMRRLAIIDLEGGQQPVYNEDGSVAVVFNGEIYGYRELGAWLRSRGHVLRTQSDTEVLVHLYEELGERMCEPLNGMFAFALWDARAQRLVLGRDRLGKKPLYYALPASGGIVFASELKALRPLARAAGHPWTVSEQGVYDYLSLGVVPQPETIFESVMTLPPASTTVFERGAARIRSYWQLPTPVDKPRDYAEILAETRILVRRSVRRRLRSDVPLGVFLSSGVDSSIVAYEASRDVGSELRTFTIGTDDPKLDESGIAARTAMFLGVRNEQLRMRVAPSDDLQFIVRHFDQPYADSSAIATLAVARLARQHVTVVLNGDGGDELFGGYRRYLAARALGVVSRMPSWLQQGAARSMAVVADAAPRRSPLGFAKRFLRGSVMARGERYLVWTTDMLRERDKRGAWKGGPARSTESWIEAEGPADTASTLGFQRLVDLRVNLLSDLLVKMDMSTMAASLEARSPLLDYELAEFTARLPDRVLLQGWQAKPLLRDAYRGLLPADVIDGPKRGFEVPIETWLRTDLRSLIEDSLGSHDAAVRSYLDGDLIDGILAGERLQERNWGGTVYALLVLELWLRGQAETGELAS